jgi:L-seryl-tRNA(Ser) seleniumtransferase
VITEDRRKYLREIPSVDEVLERDCAKELVARYPRAAVVKAIQAVLDEYRKRVLSHDSSDGGASQLALDLSAFCLEERVKQLTEPHLRKVVNATGVVIHTNLGRSPLAEEAIEAIAEVSRSYSNLELDLAAGQRGSRYAHVREVLCDLTGAESAVVVNNNAAAVLLALNTLARGKEVIVSRGELIEIGGAFRIPDVIERSGARLVEVGTTNKTKLRDYERATGPETAALLKVHTSNYRIVGFTEDVALKELVDLGARLTLPVINDLGSGSLVDLSPFQLEREPTVGEAVATGADVVTFSGDKLLGGPQAGLIVGQRATIEAIERNPLNRALRIDKLTLAGLEATLRLYLDERKATDKIPTLRMLTLPLGTISKRAKKLAQMLDEVLDDDSRVSIEEVVSQVGGGALPLQFLPSRAVALQPSGVSAQELAERLCQLKVPIITRIQQDKVLLDVRTIREDELSLIPEGVKEAVA